ncbi:MAG: peptide ABC transporter substrate-binding protein [Clostridiaceae bacterium]
MKKLISLVLSIALMATLLVGCGADKVEDVTLKYNLGADPKTIDPQLNSASDGADLINNMFEGLMREVDGTLEEAMAESYEVSEDKTVYTFTLRDAKWSDGEAVKAGDFEFAWKRAINPDTASEYSFIMAPIKNATAIMDGEMDYNELGVKAIDDKTLEVTLEAPTDYFLGLTGFFTYMPVREDVVDAEGIWAKDAEKSVSNGPFVLSEYKTSDKIVLKKNENYWNADKVKIGTIDVSMIVEASTALTAYQSDELDIIEDAPTSDIPTLQAEDPTFYVIPMVGTYYYTFNLNDVPELQDVKIRQALNLALDKEAIVETVSKGGQIPATGFVPSGLTDANGDEFRTVAGDYGLPTKADVEGAKALLAEAGYPNGEGFPTLTLSYNTSEGHKAIAEAVQNMWKENLGINVELSNSEWAVFQDERQTQNFEIARGGWVGDYADPLTMLDIWLSTSSQNYGKWSNDAFDQDIKDAAKLTGQERMDKFYDAEKILYEEMPCVPIYYYTDILMVKDTVKGWEKTKMDQMWLGYASIED